MYNNTGVFLFSTQHTADTFEEVVDDQKQEWLLSSTIADSSKLDEDVSVMQTKFVASRSGVALSLNQTSEMGSVSKKGYGKRRSEYQKGHVRHAKLKRLYGSFAAPRVDTYMSSLLEKENKLRQAKEEIEKLKSYLEHPKNDEEQEEGPVVSAIT